MRNLPRCLCKLRNYKSTKYNEIKRNLNNVIVFRELPNLVRLYCNV